MKKNQEKNKLYSFIQVIILMIAIFAFAWMLGSSVETVSADGEVDKCIGVKANPGEKYGDWGEGNFYIACSSEDSSKILKTNETGHWVFASQCADNQVCEVSSCKCVAQGSTGNTDGNTGTQTTTSTCGNGVINSGEQCDGTNLNEKECIDIPGYSGGSLSCYPPGGANECQFDTTSCQGIFYSGQSQSGANSNLWSDISTVGQTYQTLNSLYGGLDKFGSSSVDKNKEAGKTAEKTTSLDGATLADTGNNNPESSYSSEQWKENLEYSQEQLNSAQEDLDAAKLTNDEGKISAAQEKVDYANGKVDEAKAGLSAATTATSPFDLGSFLTGSLVSIGAALAAKALIDWALTDWLGVSEGNFDVLNTASWVGAGVGAAAGIALSALGSAGILGGAGSTTAVVATAAAGFAVSTVGIGLIVIAIVVVITAAVAGFSYQDYSAETITYKVGVWQPPKGGENCEKCNDLRYGCSEYQCHSFGQGCVLANPGTTQERCVWNNSNDKLPPEITQWDDILEDNYSYSPSEVVSPPDHGLKVIYTPSNKGCIPPYTNLTLGFKTNEPAYCKADIERKANFTELGFDIDQGNSFIYNHTLFLPSSAFPSASALNNLGLTINDDKSYYFYFMCEDFNGNSNEGNFVMQFCTDMGPDERAPIIEGTNYLPESYISYNQTEAYLEVYTDEPATCKWDFTDLEYKNMNYNMTWCSPNTNEYLDTSSLTYGCKGNLEGLKSSETNAFYIRCKDQPWFGGTDNEYKQNENRQSYVLSLTGTYPLAIDDITINGKANNSLIKDSTDVVEVELDVTTSGGADKEGGARCQYAVDGDYFAFYNGGSFDYNYINTQLLNLAEGNYTYPIKCVDKGGNTAESSISFNVERDSSPPEAVRVYYEGGNLKLITNEPAQCVYSTYTGCSYNFEDGTPMTDSEDNLEHFVGWSTGSDLFIKCQDKYKNRPTIENGNYQCTIIVRGSEF